MSKLARIAVGSLRIETDHQPMLWALLDVLERSGAHVQTFRSQACFPAVDGVSSITGQSHRHLDTWLMSSELCRELFRRGAQSCDLAIVEGSFTTCTKARSVEQGNAAQTGHVGQHTQKRNSDAHTRPLHTGGSLRDLCGWLDMPRIGVLDVAQTRPCEISIRRPPVDALFLDGVDGIESYCRLQTQLEALWGIPVLGALESLGHVRREIGSPRCGGKACRERCRQLGNNLLRYLDFSQLMSLAQRREFPAGSAFDLPTLSLDQKLHVAVAYDDAFHCYFADTLDMLEMGGATLKAFSPLRDESLPENTDLVYFGCGHPEKHAWALARNHCMHMALREHVHRDGPVYAEGGGVAYLGQHMVLPDRSRVPMVGALPIDSQLCADRGAARPREIELSRSSWLGEAGTRLRGYLNPQWHLQPLEDVIDYAGPTQNGLQVLGRKQLIGSLLHLHFGAQPEFLNRLFVRHGQPESTVERVTASS